MCVGGDGDHAPSVFASPPPQKKCTLGVLASHPRDVWCDDQHVTVCVM